MIIPFILPWNWSADYQKQTCLELAKNHKVIAYMQKDAIFFLKAIGNRSVVSYPTHKNISFYRPLYILPFRRIQIIEKLNQTISFVLFQLSFARLHSFVLWIFDPYFYYLLYVARCMSLYDCVDYAWSRNKSESDEIQRLENKVIRKVDYFFVNSQVLNNIHKSTRTPDAIVPQGFRIFDFKTPTRFHKSFFGKGPIIGYVGAINHRIDFKLILKLSRKNPSYRFVLWGYIQEFDDKDLQTTRRWADILSKEKNIIIGRSAHRSDIPSVIRQFDIAMIPYILKNKAVRFSYPMKLFEYFYMGKPVIATPIEELKRFSSYVKIGSKVADWEHLIKSLLANPWSSKYQVEQKGIAVKNSWENKIFAILREINMNSNNNARVTI